MAVLRNIRDILNRKKWNTASVVAHSDSHSHNLHIEDGALCIKAGHNLGNATCIYKRVACKYGNIVCTSKGVRVGKLWNKALRHIAIVVHSASRRNNIALLKVGTTCSKADNGHSLEWLLRASNGVHNTCCCTSLADARADKCIVVLCICCRIECCTHILILARSWGYN